MPVAAVPSRDPFDPGPMETVGGPKSVKAKASKAGRPKPSVGSAWTAWQTDLSAAARDEFLPGIASWSQGTAAQLLRRPWPAEATRPTAAQVEERLVHHLELVAKGPALTYLEALEAARRGVIEELRKARLG